MEKLQIYILIVFLIFFYLSNNSLIGVNCETNNNDVYTSILEDLDLSTNFINYLHDDNVRSTFEKCLIEENLLYHLNNKIKKSENYIIKNLEKRLIDINPEMLNKQGRWDILKDKILKLCSTLYCKYNKIVEEFWNDFINYSMDIGIIYRNFETKYLEEYNNIEKLKMKYISSFSTANETFNKIQLDENSNDSSVCNCSNVTYKCKCDSDDNENECNCNTDSANDCTCKYNTTKKEIIKQIKLLNNIINKLKDKIAILYVISYGLYEFKKDMDIYVEKYKNQKVGLLHDADSTDSNEKPIDKIDGTILNVLYSLMDNLIFKLRKKITISRDTLQNEIVKFEKELNIFIKNVNIVIKKKNNNNDNNDSDNIKFESIENSELNPVFINVDWLKEEYEQYVQLMEKHKLYEESNSDLFSNDITDSVAPGNVSPEGAMSDGVIPDGVIPDGVIPDGVIPDGVIPDGVIP
ncbi:conserved protein, unknown function, partial [Hepatocystis sp. ex Piliocolobus tephrosceles]